MWIHSCILGINKLAFQSEEDRRSKVPQRTLNLCKYSQSFILSSDLWNRSLPSSNSQSFTSSKKQLQLQRNASYYCSVCWLTWFLLKNDLSVMCNCQSSPVAICQFHVSADSQWYLRSHLLPVMFPLRRRQTLPAAVLLHGHSGFPKHYLLSLRDKKWLQNHNFLKNYLYQR